RTIWHRWTLAAFGYLTGLLGDLDKDADLNADVNFCGVFQSAEDSKETLRLARAIQNLPLDLVRPVTAEEASKLCGTTISHNGVFFNRGGVLSPGKLCQLLLQQAKAIVHRGVRIDRLYLDGSKSGWIAEGQELDSRNVFDGEYDVVVLATGPGTPDFKLTQAPFDIVRGQMHYIPENSLPGLRSVICHSGYLTPGTGTGSTSNSSLAAGSTYSRTDVSTTAHLAGQKEILQKLKTGVPDLKADLDLMPGFVGLRIACQDRMPLIGPVSGKPGLYVSTGHGSRGILSSPLAGEIIAAHVCGDPIPVESDLFDHFAERYTRRLASRNNDKRNRN
ncbi:MAG: FAD-dependent oxidoreductase, partial [Spirochaetia bacterium]|nr:FAD-dependent oxidoreductase [Spirochaetia bacterium]